MTQRIVLSTYHSIAEYDDLRMLSDLGYEVVSLGAYLDPAHPGDNMRPALPDVPAPPQEVRDACADTHAAKQHYPDVLLEWLGRDGILISHHYLEQTVVDQWDRLKAHGIRVVWRTCGQSDPRLESVMKPLHDDGLTIVRYSPKEQEFFSQIGTWAGEDALIRFGKYYEDYPLWLGDGKYVANVTQDMVGRGDWCGLSFWQEATEGLNAKPAGPGSEKLPGGIGALSYPDMLDYLAHASAYLYMGTAPASYTLGMIEAMFVGVPIVCMPAGRFMVPPLFEAPDILQTWSTETPAEAQAQLVHLLELDEVYARRQSDFIRSQRTNTEFFDVRKIAPQWGALLGGERATFPGYVLTGERLEAVA